MQFSPALFRFLLGVTRRDRDLAEDLVQETFLEAARKWPELRDLSDRPLFAWLRQVAANKAVDAFRKNETTRKARPIDPAFLERETDAYHDAMTSMAIRHFTVTIDRMPQRRRLAAFLRWRCGWKPSEIAEALMITPAAVTHLLNMAQATLREELQGHVPFEPGAEGEGGRA